MIHFLGPLSTRENKSYVVRDHEPMSQEWDGCQKLVGISLGALSIKLQVVVWLQQRHSILYHQRLCWKSSYICREESSMKYANFVYQTYIVLFVCVFNSVFTLIWQHFRLKLLLGKASIANLTQLLARVYDKLSGLKMKVVYYITPRGIENTSYENRLFLA